MITKALMCTHEECEHRAQEFESMSKEELERHLKRCEACENGPFKEDLTAVDTYNKLTTRWAEIHNITTGRAS